MLILTSNGLSSDKLLNRVKVLTESMKSAVIVTTASVGYKQNDKHIPRLTEELSSLGVSVDFFDFDKDKPKNLIEYDVIELNGGNPFYLLKSIQQANCYDILKEIVKNKIVIGISAGALVFQSNIELFYKYTPNLNDDVGLKDFSALNLTDVNILPHYHRFLKQFDNFEQTAFAYEKQKNIKLIRLDDGQGVIDSLKGHILI